MNSRIATWIAVIYAFLIVTFEFAFDQSFVHFTFITGLSLATTILILGGERFKNLLQEEDSLRFYRSLYPNSTDIDQEIQNDIQEIFYHKNSIFSGLAYAMSVGVTYHFIGKNVNEPVIHLLIVGFLAYINFFTGYTAYSLFIYFKMIKKWVSLINIGVFYNEKPEFRFLRRHQQKLLALCLWYSLISQTVTIFSNLESQFIVYSYTAFAVVMIGIIKIYFNLLIFQARERAFYEKIDQFNLEINYIYSLLVENDNIRKLDKDLVHTLDELIRLKTELVSGFSKTKVTTQQVLTLIGLTITVFVPIFLEYIINLL